MVVSNEGIGFIVAGIICFFLLVALGYCGSQIHKKKQEKERIAHERFLANLNP